jgi:hypothetical protein
MARDARVAWEKPARGFAGEYVARVFRPMGLDIGWRWAVERAGAVVAEGTARRRQVAKDDAWHALERAVSAEQRKARIE